MGWPQTRSRYFMVARKGVPPIDPDHVGEGLALPKEEGALPMWWAISDLADVERDDHMHRRPEYTPANQKRINYLHSSKGKKDFSLPLELHNEKHQPDYRMENDLEPTTYTSVYGRLNPDQPAGTITTGFLTPGRGRYVHPTKKRTINPAEAARLQGFPDDYRFTVDGKPPSSQLLTKWIGDAVPTSLGYAAAIAALVPGLQELSKTTASR